MTTEQIQLEVAMQLAEQNVRIYAGHADFVAILEKAKAAFVESLKVIEQPDDITVGLSTGETKKK